MSNGKRSHHNATRSQADLAGAKYMTEFLFSLECRSPKGNVRRFSGTSRNS
jgi:hypothetical protein